MSPKKQIWSIYIITHPNGKQYVGLTNNINSRKSRHFGSRCHNSPLKRDIQKLIHSMMQFDVICSCQTKDDAHFLEHLFIKEYNTLSPNGYNLQP